MDDLALLRSRRCDRLVRWMTRVGIGVFGLDSLGKVFDLHPCANLNEARQIIEEWRIDYTPTDRTRASTGSHRPSSQPAPTGAKP